jgi:segregation and condensation protein B
MELKLILEAALFSTQKPLSARELREVLARAAEASDDPNTKPFRKVPEADLVSALEQLEREHREANRSYRLTCVAGAWQFVSQPEFAPWLRAVLGEKNRPARLSQASLETLAIVAYRQPLTRAEIEQIRGVSVDGVMQTLLERGLLEQVGRADAPGHPGTYGTTREFLEYFGLRSLDDLPAAEELRRVQIDKPAGLVTAEPGLATAPPEQLTLQPVTAGSPAPTPAVDAPEGPASRPEPAPTGSGAADQPESP